MKVMKSVSKGRNPYATGSLRQNYIPLIYLSELRQEGRVASRV